MDNSCWEEKKERNSKEARELKGESSKKKPLATTILIFCSCAVFPLHTKDPAWNMSSTSFKRDHDEEDNDIRINKQKPTTLEEAANEADNNAEPFVNPTQDNQVEVALITPAYLNNSIDGQPPLHDKLLDSLKEMFFPSNDGNRRTTRSACKQTDSNDAPIVPNNHKYGFEIYVQTEAFHEACQEQEPKYTRIPADKNKHSIPEEQTPWLEKHVNLGPLRELCAHINQENLIDGKTLYLIQLVHYCADAEFDRGRHIDNVDNGGHIIVGITLGDKPLSDCIDDEERYRNISFDYHNKCRFTKKLPPGSVYVMKGQCRYEFYHDAKKPKDSSHYVIMLRYGKAE